MLSRVYLALANGLSCQSTRSHACTAATSAYVGLTVHRARSDVYLRNLNGRWPSRWRPSSSHKENRWSNPARSLLTLLNFDRFHQPRLFTGREGGDRRPHTTRSNLPRGLPNTPRGSPTYALTRQYHCRMLIRPSLDTEAFSSHCCHQSFSSVL